MKKIVSLAILVVIIAIAVVFWWRYYFVFGEGVKAGTVNFIVKKGYVFKTFEGRLIQSGIKTTTPGALQSNEFDFSVTNDSIAAILERCSGKEVELRYKEHLHPIAWRGMSNYIVFEILSIDNKKPDENLPFLE
jgi:hypothetical protein